MIGARMIAIARNIISGLVFNLISTWETSGSFQYGDTQVVSAEQGSFEVNDSATNGFVRRAFNKLEWVASGQVTFGTSPTLSVMSQEPVSTGNGSFIRFDVSFDPNSVGLAGMSIHDNLNDISVATRHFDMELRGSGHTNFPSTIVCTSYASPGTIFEPYNEIKRTTEQDFNGNTVKVLVVFGGYGNEYDGDASGGAWVFVKDSNLDTNWKLLSTHKTLGIANTCYVTLYGVFDGATYGEDKGFKIDNWNTGKLPDSSIFYPATVYRNNGVAEGAGWTLEGSAFVWTGTQINFPTTGKITRELGHSYCIMEADLFPTGSAQMSFVFNEEDADNYWLCTADSQLDQMRIERVVAGGAIQIMATVSTTIPAGHRWYMRWEGDTVSCWISNNALVWSKLNYTGVTGNGTRGGLKALNATGSYATHWISVPIDDPIYDTVAVTTGFSTADIRELILSDANLVGMWDMQESSGSLIHDDSGNNRDISFTDTLNKVYQSDDLTDDGYASIDFTANTGNTLADKTTPSWAHLHSDFTLEIIVKPDTWFSAATLNSVPLFTQGLVFSSVGNVNYYLTVRGDVDRLELHIYSSTTSTGMYVENFSTFYPADGSNVYHIIATWDNDTKNHADGEIYINGFPAATLRSATTLAERVIPLSQYDEFYVGTNYPTSTPKNHGLFDGHIAFAAIYDRKMSAIDVIEHAAASGNLDLNYASYTQAILARDPLIYYKYNETSGSALAIDSSGNGNHATVFGTGLTQNAVNPDLVGDGGVSLYLNGVNGAFGMQTHSFETIVGTKDFTFEMVFRSGPILQFWEPFLHWGSTNLPNGVRINQHLSTSEGLIVYFGIGHPTLADHIRWIIPGYASDTTSTHILTIYVGNTWGDVKGWLDGVPHHSKSNVRGLAYDMTMQTGAELRVGGQAQDRGFDTMGSAYIDGLSVTSGEVDESIILQTHALFGY